MSELTIENIFSRIARITDTPNHNLLHLMEEVGELSTEIMIEEGVTYKKSDEGILGEAGDVVVCGLALMANKTTSWATVLAYLDKKLKKWEMKANERKSS